VAPGAFWKRKRVSVTYWVVYPENTTIFGAGKIPEKNLKKTEENPLTIAGSGGILTKLSRRAAPGKQKKLEKSKIKLDTRCRMCYDSETVITTERVPCKLNNVRKLMQISTRKRAFKRAKARFENSI
jgi:hypothetical protein